MMRRLRFCCEGVDIISLVPETKGKIKTEPWSKTNDATVIPPKRKCVKNTVCNCFVQCICAKCFNTNNTLSPPRPITAGNYRNKTKSVK
ncbi:unnamed protein product [Trifolium pratense]|uniref:Uncharacterized protein n=1 Tax=Trifolium pratense TaxID=57577 RepID=A0ACB0LHR6_TRIPR|nr:unnamed protein product [Trifolium pratense]